MAGYCGQFVRINLTEGTVRRETPDRAAIRHYIGGRGLGSFPPDAQLGDILQELQITREEVEIILINGRPGRVDSPVQAEDVVCLFPLLAGG